MNKTLHTYFFASLLALLVTAPVAAQEYADDRRPLPSRGWHGFGPGPGFGPGRSPYGAYCPKRHADRYGARQPVTTAAEARERLLQFFGADQVTVTNIVELPRHFKADILDRNGTLLDTVIIDRRNGRIRSIL